ncbi:MAG: hypothetical protein E6J86_18460 [Deltaproteobacteria bacterium]|nr:MAG: hypothetical protein E6J86_18460 [Deltaproteobacteria bacterium]
MGGDAPAAREHLGAGDDPDRAGLADQGASGALILPQGFVAPPGFGPAPPPGPRPPPGRPPRPPGPPRPPPGPPRPPGPRPRPPPGPRSLRRSCMTDSIEKLPSSDPSAPFLPPPEGRRGPRRPPRSSRSKLCFIDWGIRSTTYWCSPILFAPWTCSSAPKTRTRRTRSACRPAALTASRKRSRRSPEVPVASETALSRSSLTAVVSASSSACGCPSSSALISEGLAPPGVALRSGSPCPDKSWSAAASSLASSAAAPGCVTSSAVPASPGFSMWGSEVRLRGDAPGDRSGRSDARQLRRKTPAGFHLRLGGHADDRPAELGERLHVNTR